MWRGVPPSPDEGNIVIYSPQNPSKTLPPSQTHQNRIAAFLPSSSAFSLRLSIAMATKRLIPALNRILVEKIVPPSKTNAGILLPEKTSKVRNPISVSLPSPNAYHLALSHIHFSFAKDFIPSVCFSASGTVGSKCGNAVSKHDFELVIELVCPFGLTLLPPKPYCILSAFSASNLVSMGQFGFKHQTLNSGKVIAVGPGARDREGKLIPVTFKEGETVLLPEYGGTEVKLGEKESMVHTQFMYWRDSDDPPCGTSTVAI
ncbi:10 kda heat shock protein [Asimina triloba]